MVARFGFIEAKRGVWEVVKTAKGGWVQYTDHEHALAEKDQQYQQLMTQVVRFAQYVTCNSRWQERVWDEAQAFLKEHQP